MRHWWHDRKCALIGRSSSSLQPLEKERSDLEQEAARLRAERDKCEAKITEIKTLMLEQQQQ